MDRAASLTRKYIGIILILLLLLALSVWSLRLVRIGQSLRQHLAQAQALAASPGSIAPQQACTIVRDLRHDLTALRRTTFGLVRLAPAFGWLPRIGGDLRAAPHLVTVADGLTEAGTIGCTAFAPALAGEAAGDVGLSPQTMVTLAASHQTELEAALAAVDRAQGAWAHVEVETLSPFVAGKVDRLETALPLLRAGLEGALVAPALLGAEEPRSYLLLAQNNDELRPTGGFLTAAGVLRVENGRIVDLSFMDSYAIDDFSNPYPQPPEPLQKYMLADLWLFRDSNWSPDFPTAAAQAAHFFEIGTGQNPDGVVAIDMTMLHMLVAALAPLDVAGATEPITGQNVVSWIRQARGGLDTEDEDWWRNRKDFMGPLAKALKARLESGDVDWFALANAIQKGLREKHLLVSVDDPEAQTLLGQRGWNGAIANPEGDYLYVVDGNLGFNKVNPLIDTTIAYTVTLERDGPPTGELTLLYTNRSRPNEEPCNPEPHYGANYETEMHRCYWNYLRVYVPEGSRLRSATPAPLPKASLRHQKMGGAGEETRRIGPPEFGKQVFGVYFLVPRNAQRVQRFRYTLPAGVMRRDGDVWHYSLTVQKQPGARARPVRITLLLPPEARLVSASEPVHRQGSRLRFERRLDHDQEITVTYRR